jgi:alcohol dehydrogenase (cytochrome c)
MDEVVYQLEEEFAQGRMFSRGWNRVLRGGRQTGGLRALDGSTGDVVWETMFDGAASKAGLLVTAGDLVFAADRSGMLYALDAKTGEKVWRTRLGGDIEMGPITYLHQGKQQLAVIARGALFVLDLVD